MTEKSYMKWRWRFFIAAMTAISVSALTLAAIAWMDFQGRSLGCVCQCDQVDKEQPSN